VNSTGDEWTAAGRLIGCLGAGGAAPVTQLAEGLHGRAIPLQRRRLAAKSRKV